MEWDDMLLERLPYPTETVVYFTDQNWISKIEYWLRFLMVCKIFSCSEFPKRMEKIGKCKEFTFLRASMVVTNYIKLLRTGADKHNGILIRLLLLVAETKNKPKTTADSCHPLTWSSFLKVFYIRTVPRISEHFLENILGLVYFIEKGLQNEYFPNNFLISLRAPLECFYCSTINKIQIKGK